MYQTRVHDIDELRQSLITVWCELEQRIVDDTIELINGDVVCWLV